MSGPHPQNGAFTDNAVKCIVRSKIDLLVLEDFVIDFSAVEKHLGTMDNDNDQKET